LESSETTAQNENGKREIARENNGKKNQTGDTL
jgi:hypothetical protein